jgi:hydroxymethylpyrimidine pyrophosphatase-like HAD family hydrolase
MAFPRLIAIDMDGTLLNSSARISPRNLAALHLAEAAGVEPVIATGRRHCYAMHVLRDLPLAASNALISSNGAVIRTFGHHLLHRSYMPLETARWLCAHAGDFRSSLVLTFDTVDETGEDSCGALVSELTHDLHDSINQWMLANQRYIQHVDRIEDALHGDPPIQMMICGGIDRMSQAEALLRQDPRVSAVGEPSTDRTEITLHRTSYPQRDLSIVDILPAGCSKASALEHLLHLRGLTTTDLMAIGDNWNDLPMLELAAHPVLMANAPTDLKALAHSRHWTIAPTNDNDGVAHAIESALATTPLFT